MVENAFELVQPRPKVEIHLPDGRILSGPRGASLEQFLRSLPEWQDTPIVGAVVNHELRELTYPVMMEARVIPVTTADADGARIYRRSLVFLLEVAFEELFGEAVLSVDHSVSSGGFFCQVHGRPGLSDDELDRLKRHMQKLVEEDIPFERSVVPLSEAIDLFTAKKMTEKAHLLKFRQKESLVLYSINGHRDYHHGYMVPSTGYLRWFDLRRLNHEGFVLQFPRRHAPRELLPMPDYPKLLTSFRQYGSWLKRLGIENVGALNEAIASGRIREIILVAEALHEQQVAEIARMIMERSRSARIVLIAGPSSSAKTTTLKRLAVQLLAQGISPLPLEMDNYFVDREMTPKDENGQYDFERLEALNTKLLQEHLKRLIAGEEVQLPHYDFKLGRSRPGEVVRLEKDQMIILEGIHGMNPRLLPDFAPEETFRIYVSCLTQLNLDRHNRISTTDSRLLRRIVRDARERGYSAQATISRWESVRRGEKRHIFPYQENADVFFNSALVYELSALKKFAEPLLRQVPFGNPEYIEAKRLLAFLDWFLPVDVDLIPDNSLLREFIGGSILQEFRLWEKPLD
ncbi:uridine kinase [Anaerolinea thermolimosa]|uniref:nucleoside kinase n=1 Tax=Anaerolinea thermolimosa TaxID=229919 RepID=UPI000785F20B|nr:nucleoside kinase [Anaerolinea thermolimosa]GAP05760.1 uridine kinase [Anaerolinea thermolimosa]